MLASAQGQSCDCQITLKMSQESFRAVSEAIDWEWTRTGIVVVQQE
jgi:hypothetical protein